MFLIIISNKDTFLRHVKAYLALRLLTASPEANILAQ